MRCSTSLKDPVQASVTCLGGATSGAIPDLVRPRPAFGCDAVSCRTGRVRRHWGCHLYFARRVSFLSCADTLSVSVGWSLFFTPTRPPVLILRTHRPPSNLSGPLQRGCF